MLLGNQDVKEYEESILMCNLIDEKYKDAYI